MSEKRWEAICKTDDVAPNSGAAIYLDGIQLAVFNIESRGLWFATQNRCPHWNEMVLSRATVGEENGKVKIACPMHKKTFNLQSGCGLSDADMHIQTFAVKIEDDLVWIEYPNSDFFARERDILNSWKQANG